MEESWISLLNLLPQILLQFWLWFFCFIIYMMFLTYKVISEGRHQETLIDLFFWNATSNPLANPVSSVTTLYPTFLHLLFLLPLASLSKLQLPLTRASAGAAGQQPESFKNRNHSSAQSSLGTLRINPKSWPWPKVYSRTWLLLPPNIISHHSLLWTLFSPRGPLAVSWMC